MTGRILAALLLSLTARPAAAGHIYVGDFRVTGAGILIPGTLTVTFGGRDFRPVGWGLLVLGTLVTSGSVGSERDKPARVEEAWAHMVREAKVFRRHPELIADEHEIRAAARVLHLSPSDLSTLVVDLHRRPEDAPAVTARYFPRGFVDERQERAYRTLLALAHAG